MASGVADVCLIPEVSFDLYGEHGVLEYISGLLRRKGHCVVCVAEGAGQVRLAMASRQCIDCALGLSPVTSLSGVKRGLATTVAAASIVPLARTFVGPGGYHCWGCAQWFPYR